MGDGGARLLVADDNKVNRLLLTRNLVLLGHRVATAEVAKRRTMSFCWSRRRFFSRLEPTRALSNTGFTGLGR